MQIKNYLFSAGFLNTSCSDAKTIREALLALKDEIDPTWLAGRFHSRY